MIRRHIPNKHTGHGELYVHGERQIDIVLATRTTMGLADGHHEARVSGTTNSMACFVSGRVPRRDPFIAPSSHRASSSPGACLWSRGGEEEVGSSCVWTLAIPQTNTAWSTTATLHPA